MKKQEKDSILTIIKRTLQQNRRSFIVMSFLFAALILYFLWSLDKLQTENIEIREAVYELEKDNLNEQLSVMKICLAQSEESKTEYTQLSDIYDIKIQEQIKNLRQILPEEKDNLNSIQKILQSAWQDRQLAIMSASLNEEWEKALTILEEDYSPKMEQIAQICTELSQKAALEGKKQIQNIKITMIGVICALIVLAVLEIIISHRQHIKIKRLINIPIGEIITAMRELEKGNLAYESTYTSDNEMGMLMESIRKTTRILRGYIGNIEYMLKALSEKEYTVKNQYVYSGDFVRISDAINTIIGELNSTVKEISTDTEIVREAGLQVEKLAVVLAKDTMDNAASVEELSASIEEIVEQVNRSKEKIADVNSAEKEVTGWAEECCERMEHLGIAMDNTIDSTKYLQSFINDLEDITDEITMLSLNASIEAARAGKEGKGFAVVAEQIRKLSAQTAEAAEKAKQYINNCVHEVQSGKSQAEHTGNQVVMITEQMRNIRNMVEDINRVSEIQLNEIKGFEKSIQDMANIIQNDSGIAVHLEGHSESLKMCVDEMSGKMEEFKVN